MTYGCLSQSRSKLQAFVFIHTEVNYLVLSPLFFYLGICSSVCLEPAEARVAHHIAEDPVRGFSVQHETKLQEHRAFSVYLHLIMKNLLPIPHL